MPPLPYSFFSQRLPLKTLDSSLPLLLPSLCARTRGVLTILHPRYTTPGGYSSKAVRPIALAKVQAIASMMRAEFPDAGRSLSGIGGVESGETAAEFILLGADTVQVRACVRALTLL